MHAIDGFSFDVKKDCVKVLLFFLIYDKILLVFAGVAELADAPDLGSGISDVQVQVLSPAPFFISFRFRPWNGKGVFLCSLELLVFLT